MSHKILPRACSVASGRSFLAAAMCSIVGIAACADDSDPGVGTTGPTTTPMTTHSPGPDDTSTGGSTGTETDAETGTSETGDPIVPGAEYDGPAFDLQEASVVHDRALDALVFQVSVGADAGSVAPQPVGAVDGAPVLGYVFPTSLAPTDVGFGALDGTVALAVTSHPDFDDTPLWDDDNNDVYDDDGVTYHTHWVVLVDDDRAEAGLAVAQAADLALLPPTAPMPMYLDSPGFAVLEADETLRVVVPLDRVNRRTDFTADAVTAFMEVDASGDAPLLKVQNVYDILSGDLSLPLTVSEHNDAPSDTPLDPKGDAFDIADAAVQYISSLDVWVFSMQTQGTAASVVPDPHGALDGAPVLGYVFPVSLAPDAVGFGDIDGTLVLAVTSHPDFDDTPFWDETLDGDYANDGGKYHVHWAVLVADEDSAAGLTVPAAGDDATLPPTAPMPMYLDSPGFHAFASGSVLRVLVPAVRIDRQPSFNFDAVTARMQVDAGGDAAVLRVQEVFEVLSGDLSLPYTTETLASSDEL